MSFTVGENHEKTIDLSHDNNKLYQTMCASQVLMEIMGFELTAWVMIIPDCMGSCQFKYYSITITTATNID